MFKSTALSIALSVTKLLKSVNSSSTGNIPHKWELSSVIPIPKSSVNTDNPSNNRPTISKLQEIHIYNVVLKHLTERETLAGAQWGFTPEKPVMAHLSTFHDSLVLICLPCLLWPAQTFWYHTPSSYPFCKPSDCGLDQHISSMDYMLPTWQRAIHRCGWCILWDIRYSYHKDRSWDHYCSWFT